MPGLLMIGSRSARAKLNAAYHREHSSPAGGFHGPNFVAAPLFRPPAKKGRPTLFGLHGVRGVAARGFRRGPCKEEDPDAQDNQQTYEKDGFHSLSMPR
jgi:hypothetical protein